MGIRGSKQLCGGGTGGDSCSSSSASLGHRKKERYRGSRALLSSCLGNASGPRSCRNFHRAFLHKKKKDDGADSNEAKIDMSRRIMPEQTEEITRVSSIVDIDEYGPAAGSTSAQVTSSPSRFFSRFSFIPGNLSYRISRASNLRSKSCISPSASMRINAEDAEFRSRASSMNGILSDNGAQQIGGSDLTSQTNLNVRQLSPESQTGMQSFSEGPKSGDATTSSSHESSRNVGGNNSVIFQGAQSLSGTDAGATRMYESRVGTREPADRSVRFSRTLSVGRLRDRVLRRSAMDFTVCPFDREREVTSDGYDCVVRTESGTEVGAVEFEREALTSSSRPYHPPSLPSASFSMHNHELEISRSREARYHSLLEHRSNFVERRRRIRSQVRALQRIGNRFENFSGHERSCILSGQHRAGHCSCRLSNREAGNDDASARTSISRIVMLAEALFEVLDEIHQQSVVLSSRSSGSSIGSVPAPVDVVESLPLKTFCKSKKCENDEAAQCYICLVEYEDGDSMRVLPCHHEFHRTCVDKWLKEIHRICPLCRGDVCRSDSLSPEG